MNRRRFLKSVLAAGVAPYVVTTAGVLMPVRQLWTPTWHAIEITWMPPEKSMYDPLGQRGYVGAKGRLDVTEYGILFEMTNNGFPTTAAARKDLENFAIARLKLSSGG